MKQAGQLYIPDEDEFFQGIFEDSGDKFDYPNLTKALEFVSDFTEAIDIGAHVGSWTRVLADKFKRVLAFEPFTQNRLCLEENTRHLKNVTRMACAIGDSNGFCGMENDKRTNSGKWCVADGNHISVIPLDDFRLRDCNFIKIDVEGYELFVLKGAVETIRTHRPTILIELNGLGERYGVKDEEVKHFLESLGYIVRARIGKDYVYGYLS